MKVEEINQVDENLKRLYGITVEQKPVYVYEGNKYENLKDALNYAKLDTERAHDSNGKQEVNPVSDGESG